MKKLMPILTLTLLLSGCSIINGQSSSNSSTGSSNVNSSTHHENQNSSISDESLSNSEISNSSSSIKDDFEMNLKEPDFLNRKISSKEDVKYTDLFNLGNHIKIDIQISDVELNKLQSDFESEGKSNVYRVADKVTISLTNYENTFVWEYDNVGIRQKGNTSRLDILIDGEINTQNHFKLSFDETFDDTTLYSPEFIQEMKTKMAGDDYSKREFLGLSGLDFKWNKNEDTSHIKEVYADYLYKAGGIISQHVGLSEINMTRKDRSNQVYSFGLCNLYEQAKKDMIKYALDDGNNYVNMTSWNEEKLGAFGITNEKYGDLYECGYGVGEGLLPNGADLGLNSLVDKKIGVGNDEGTYVPAYERKTTKKLNYDDGRLKNLITVINNGNYQDLEQVVDLKYLAIEEALTYVIGNPDAMRYNYNNYMIYFRRTDGKAIIIPIDSDRCFGITKDLNFQNGLSDGEVFSKETLQGEQRNNLLNKTIFSSESNECKKTYLEMCKLISNSSWVDSQTFNHYVQIAKDTYSNYQFGGQNENLSFEDYISKKISLINKADNSNKPIEEGKEDTKIYDNLYIVGNFNSWGRYDETELENYHFDYLGDYQYQVTIQLKDNFPSHRLEIKINNGYSNYDLIDWTFSDDGTRLIKSKGSNFVVENVNPGDQFRITINTKTCQSVIEKI